MVFPSIPLYQDPPTWSQEQVILQNQQQQHQQQQQQLQIVPGQPPRPDGGLVRPNSMADRARLAKIPQPEQPLKCPRCESTNTKFCYFNNYSLSQPRHFCKACRRYWTRGGAMRNVPVGGGCRRNNKRNKSSAGGSSSKNSAATADRQAGDSSATSAGNNTSSFPFMSTVHPMLDYTSHVPNLGLGFSGIPSMNVDAYQHANSTSMGMEQWRLNQIQQFPFLGGMESQITQMAPVSEISYPFDGSSSVKMEDSQRGLNLARQYNINLGVNSNNNSTRNIEQFWNGGGAGDEGVTNNNATGDDGNGGRNWMTNLSRFNSSSAEHLL